MCFRMDFSFKAIQFYLFILSKLFLLILTLIYHRGTHGSLDLHTNKCMLLPLAEKRVPRNSQLLTTVVIGAVSHLCYFRLSIYSWEHKKQKTKNEAQSPECRYDPAESHSAHRRCIKMELIIPRLGRWWDQIFVFSPLKCTPSQWPCLQ